jgi:FlaA1/EpsC-like NDP-sugar epimerase
MEQIAQGGPVTVTDPEVRRYFMSPHEAVEAILAAGCAEYEGRILLPKLGEPERIADLARFLVGAREIPIRFIGLRPGEKLTEDLMLQSEVRDGAAGSLDVILSPAPAPSELHTHVARLACLLAGGDLAGLIETICALVPEYEPSSAIIAAAGVQV